VEASATTDDVPEIDLQNIQGNIAGFNKPHQRYVLLQFPNQDSARGFLRGSYREIDTAAHVAEANRSYKRAKSKGREPEKHRWFNLVLSHNGLQVLGAPELESFEVAFREGMAARAANLGDVDGSDPANWLKVFKSDVHAVAILAADLPEDLDKVHHQLSVHTKAHDVIEIGQLDGNIRPGDQAGHEHFGFKDGASQPGVVGLTDEPKPGQQMIPAGEFILGHPSLGDEQLPAPPPGAYQPVPAPAPVAFPSWATDGSMFVLRRLRQDVRGFNDFVADKAREFGISEDLVGAKLVGRYKSEAPLERTKDQPADLDTEAADPSIADASILQPEKVNNFDYGTYDTDGHLVPRAAHIRKTYPRDTNPQGAAESERHRILRRGIPYGTEFQTAESPYPGTGSPPDDQDRGLIFGCYQASLERGFEFIQTQWVNPTDFPQAGDGQDPIMSQHLESGSFSMPPDRHVSLLRWVITTGGGYYFSPSIAAIKLLAGA
jgi:Dyp-type peroxidase family